MIKFTKDWNYFVNGLCIYGGEKMNKEIFDLNKIVDEIVSMAKKKIDIYIEEKT